MNILLVAVNAKYIHSNLAVYSLKAYAEKQNCLRGSIDIAEYTINQPLDQILMDLYKRKPEILCFSCYLWNISYIEQLVCEISKVMPEIEIWLGGPEVSWNAEEVLQRLPQVRGVMRGEGEETFLDLVHFYEGAFESCGKGLDDILGITYYKEEVREEKTERFITATEERPVMADLNGIPFVYEDIEAFEHKIIYYESSRGCPF